MKDTLIPLSFAFLEERDEDRYRVLEILDMEPCVEDPCPLYDPGIAYDAALEVNQGWFERARVGPGAEARIEGTIPSPE
jgi:uncharacterized membrane protein (UPF0127 family)